MYIVAINAGSSSVKIKLFKKRGMEELTKIHIEKSKGIKFYNLLTIKNKNKILEQKIRLNEVNDAVRFAFDMIKGLVDIKKIEIIGHRVVHGGEIYHKEEIITPTVLKNIRQLSELAPLHNPINYEAIKEAKKICPQAKQVAVFDTAFHQTIPKEAYMYGLPMELYKKYKIRKYGFHGISHNNVATAIKEKKSTTKKIISCHLGNGCSITAIKNGKSVDTSMGFTPLDGIMMGTRSGSFDPEIILYLMKEKRLSIEQIENIINKKSGFKGITHTSDMREMHRRGVKGDKIADLGIDMFVYDIVQYIGAYIAALNGIDAIAFTGGIGEQAWYVRKAVLEQLTYFGIKLDEQKNKNNNITIHKTGSKVDLYVIPANEELAIAKQSVTAK